MSEPKPGWDEAMMELGAAKRERERLMRRLDAESIAYQDRGQVAVRQWARAWIQENAE